MKYQHDDITAAFSLTEETLSETGEYESIDVINRELQTLEQREVHERIIGMSVLEVIY